MVVLVWLIRSVNGWDVGGGAVGTISLPLPIGLGVGQGGTFPGMLGSHLHLLLEVPAGCWGVRGRIVQGGGGGGWGLCMEMVESCIIYGPWNNVCVCVRSSVLACINLV